MDDAHVTLRRFARIAYERDLNARLLALKDSFGQWQQGDVSVWQLETRLTDFVNGTSRALHTTYMLADPVFAVAYGVKKGVLSLDEIPSELHGEFEHLMNSLTV